ncbi:MAG: hypothetical protein M3356_00140 [Actinomycetota bacterium]|nr:hypothetical protein [Actinomycetota bacterium]
MPRVGATVDGVANLGSSFDDIFGVVARAPKALPGLPQEVAASCLRCAIAVLAADSRMIQRSLAEALAGSSIKTAPDGDRSIRASVAVPGARVAHVREHLDELSAELAAQLKHEGWTLTALTIVASDPSTSVPTAPPKKAELISAVAEAVAEHVKSYDVGELCDRLGMPTHPDPHADPFRSKRMYVSSRLQPADIDQVAAAARRFLEEFDDPRLAALMQRYRAHGEQGGTVKNLIFGSTLKPDLVITDALSNDLALVNVDEALLYDGGIPDEGLSWRALVAFVLPFEANTDLVAAGRRLHARLRECLSSDAERQLFHIYARRYRTGGFDQPALVPQVWLHYDPKASWQRDGVPPLVRQRMDFLLLLPGRRRVVLEVDGKQHFADADGHASPARYAEMVRADRELQLAGYEVYRFGGAELADSKRAASVLEPFFVRLLK